MSDVYLRIYYDQTETGTVTLADDRMKLSYATSWLDAESSFPLSIRLPLREDALDATAFLTGLLPEGRSRKRICERLRIPVDDDTALLRQLGRDCAGAFSLLPPDESPVKDEEARSVSPSELIDIVRFQNASLEAGGQPPRFSLAGAQDKLPVRVENESLWVPSAARPSTHIIKLETYKWVCFAEWMANDLARRVGLPVINLEFRTIQPDRSLDIDQPVPYLLLERYDRKRLGSRWQRLHQEDLAQALGYDSDHKYESQGGPDLATVAKLLREETADPVASITQLRDWQIFNYLVGNFDGHAKNLSLLYNLDDSVPRLAPFYDLVAIEFLNALGTTNFERDFAFHIGAEATVEKIGRKDWELLARSLHLPPRKVLSRLEEMAAAIPELAALSVDAFQAETGQVSSVHNEFLKTINKRSAWVLNSILQGRAPSAPGSAR